MRTLKLFTFTTFTLLCVIIFLAMTVVCFPWIKKMGPALLQFYSKVSLRIFRVRIESADKIPVRSSKNGGVIITANHVGALDIFLMSALYRTIYLSKDEVRRYPVIGWVASLIGIMFLKRESAFDRHRAIRHIARQAGGRIITIFPQGTTGSIEDRLPFKAGIFKTVEINRNAILFPATIRYKEDREIAWREHHILLDNLKAICAQKSIHVKVKIHEPVSIIDFAHKTIAEVCRSTQEKVLSPLRADY